MSDELNENRAKASQNERAGTPPQGKSFMFAFVTKYFKTLYLRKKIKTLYGMRKKYIL
jgi:hypothetical protein